MGSPLEIYSHSEIFLYESADGEWKNTEIYWKTGKKREKILQFWDIFTEKQGQIGSQFSLPRSEGLGFSPELIPELLENRPVLSRHDNILEGLLGKLIILPGPLIAAEL